jgi:hypothetical protein
MHASSWLRTLGIGAAIARFSLEFASGRVMLTVCDRLDVRIRPVHECLHHCLLRWSPAMEVMELTPLAEQVAELIRQSTYGRIRNLEVMESRGRVEVRGEVRTRYTKQLALGAALTMLTGDRLRERIVVVNGPVRVH